MTRLLSFLAVGFAVSQVASFVTTIYLHRALAHRALHLSAPVTFFCRVIIWTHTGIRPREWVAVHRRHHAFTDTEGDPHSPKLLGWARVQLTNSALYRRTARDGITVARYARDIPVDRWDRVLFNRGGLGVGITTTLLVVAFGPLWGPVVAVWHGVCYISLNAAVNALGHTFGRQPQANSATNLQWLALVTAGEGLHNNHHHAPTTAKLAFRWWEVDPAWPLIRLLRKVGWATVRHDRPPFRNEETTARAA